MKLVLIFLSSLILQKPVPLYGQARNPYPFYIKVKTDSGFIRKNLWDVDDSTIWVSDKKMGRHFPIPVSAVQYLVVKKPILSTPLRGTAFGAVVGPLLFSLAYVYDWEHPKGDNGHALYNYPFLPSLGYSVIAGAGIGFLTGLIDAVVFRKKIRINKSEHLFEINREKLKKYISY